LAVIALSMVFVGLLNGLMDIGIFTIRQRRTDPAWMGRAFAVSMALNFAGFPIGSALGGAIVPSSIELALGIAVVQIAFSVWWLRRHPFGPLEWLWRVATYGRRPRPVLASTP
jgi:hypothetical protein